MVLVFAGRSGAQGAGQSVRVAGMARSASPPLPAGQVMRAIADPAAGGRWLLLRDPGHPAGPGVLVYVAGLPGGQAGRAPAEDALRPVIRAGDRVVVEESTAVVEARLEAVALGPALAGAPFAARLALGGHVVRAVALGAGRAALAAEFEVGR